MASPSTPDNPPLGPEQASVDSLVESGRFASEGDVLQAAVRALRREDAALDALLRRKLAEASDDPRPPIPASEVFDRLQRRQEERRQRRGA